MDTKDKAKIFAEFLGWQKDEDGNFVLPSDLFANSKSKMRLSENCRHEYFYEFHKNWNWLMLVIEKIKTSSFDFTKTETYKYSKELQELKGIEMINFMVYYEPNEGWRSKAFMNITNICIITRSHHYEKQIICAYNLCFDFLMMCKRNNVNIVEK